MAKSSAKKIIKSNTRRLTSLRLVIGITNVLYALARGAVFRRSFFQQSFTVFDKIAWGILGLLYGLPLYTIWTAARPAFDKDGNLIHGGEDVSKAGILEYAHDVIYVSVVTQLGMIFTRWAFLLLLVIPTYGCYLAYSSGIFPSSAANPMDSNEDQSGSGTLTGLSRKERRKAERQSRK